MPFFVYTALAAIYLLALLLLWHEHFYENKRKMIAPAVLLLLIIAARMFMFGHETGDYLDFLSPWVQYFRDNGGFKALGESVGNYNPPYLYFLALFSYFDISELYLIKLLSVLFDVLLAWACMKLLSVFTSRRSLKIACFFAILCLPTVALNGAYWGQCDSIYVFFAVMSVYLALREKPVGSMITLAASLAFKLQAVFIIPVFFIFLLTGKLKPKHLFVFPVAYTVFLLPPVICGRPLFEVLTQYFTQAGSVGDAMNYNSPSLFSIFGYLDSAVWSQKAVIVAFAFMLIVFIVAAIFRKSLSDKVLLGFTVLLVIGIPFFLPHMHDRYFYLADTLSVVLAFAAPSFFPLPIFVQIASFLSYYAYLNMRFLVAPRIGGECMLISLVLTIVFVVIILIANSDRSDINEKN